MGGLISRTKTSNTQPPPKEEVTEDVPVLKRSLDFAWVTLATNDSYSLGALVLAHSLRIANTAHKLVVLITPVVSSPMREQLSNVFDVVKVVDVLDSKDEAHLGLLKRPELGVTFTKIHCWRLTEFQKCVFLDADTLVLRNCDELFEREELSAAPDVGWPDCFNTGVFVYKPSIETFNDLIRFSIEQGSFDGGDQGLLNQFFSDWATKDIGKHLPFLYNLTSVAVYSYIPAFKHYESQIRIVHFIGSGKPWLQYMDPTTKTVRPTPGAEHLTSLLQIWWDIFCEKVHPSLTKNLECARGMSNEQTEACISSITVETNNETVSSTLRKPFTPYIDKDDSRQINLPYHPFDVKSSSGELLNITFLAEREQEMLGKNRCENQFSDNSFSTGNSCSGEQDNNSKSESPVYESRESYEKLIQQPNEAVEEQRAIDENNFGHEEESEVTEETNLEQKAVENSEVIQPNENEGETPEKETSEREAPEEETAEEKTPNEEVSEEEQSPFHYNAFFPDETCIQNYLEQNISIYKPLGDENKNSDAPLVKAICDSKTEENQQQSLPRFLTIAENDKRQSLNVHKGNSCSQDKKCSRILSAVENVPSFKEENIRKTLSQEDLNFSSHDANATGELQKSKSMSNLDANPSSAEEVSFWDSHPNLNSDPNKKYSMPKLKPLLPKQQNKSFLKHNQIRPKVTQYTEFHMSSDYKDAFDESYDKLGFVEKQILEQSQLRNRKFFTVPYLIPQGTPKKTDENHSKLVQQNSIYDLADLSSCQRQRGNQPLNDITQSDNSRTGNACFLPVLKPLRPKEDENGFKNPKPKGKSAKERGTKAKMELRKAREKAKSRLEAKTKITNSHNVEEVLERLINFSKDYQNYFSDFMSENKETNEEKVLTLRPGIFKKTNSLENNHSDNNYFTPLYESPRLQYDKEFESGDGYFEDMRSREISEKGITNGETNEKGQCELKENREFYYFKDYLRQSNQESEEAAGRLSLQVNLTQPSKAQNTGATAENKVEKVWNSEVKEKSSSEDVNEKEKNFIEKESLTKTSRNWNGGMKEDVQYKTKNRTVQNDSTDYGTRYTEENNAYGRNIRAVDNRKIPGRTGDVNLKASSMVNGTSSEQDGGQQTNSDRIVSLCEAKPESKVYGERMTAEINAINETVHIAGSERKSNNENLRDDCCFKKVAQFSSQAEPNIGSLSKQGREMSETVRVEREKPKPKRGTGSSEPESRKIHTSERNIKRNRSEADSRKWEEKKGRQKRRKSSKVFALPPVNSSGDTLANLEHEKSLPGKSVDAPSRSPKLTDHSANKTAQDGRKVCNFGSLEDFSRHNSGIAGAIAKLSLQPGGLTGAESEAASTAQEDYIRRQNWEMGTMDYMGRDSFDNIWSKICETLDGKILKNANLDVATNNQDRTASKPGTSKDELGSVEIRISEGIKESEMNEFSRKAIVSGKSDLESVEKSANFTVPIVETLANVNKDQLQCNGKVGDIAEENALNVYNLAGGNSGDQVKEEKLDMSSAFPKSVEALECFGKLFVSGPVVLIPKVQTDVDDNEGNRNKFNSQQSENKLRDVEDKSAGSVISLLPEYADHKITAAVEKIEDETEKRQDSSSSGVSTVEAQTPKDTEKERHQSTSEASIQTRKTVGKEQDRAISGISKNTTRAEKNDSRKEQDFPASEKLPRISSTVKDGEEKEYGSGTFDAQSRNTLEDDAQKLRKKSPNSAQKLPKTDAEIATKIPCEDLQDAESVEVTKQKKGVLNKLLELVGVGTAAKDNKTKSEITKSVFYDVEETSDVDHVKDATKNSNKKESFCKSVFYDIEVSTQLQTNEGRSTPKTLESNTDTSGRQINEKCISSNLPAANQLSDCKSTSDGEKDGDTRTSCATAKATADVDKNNKEDKREKKDSASCEISLGTADKSKEKSVPDDPNVKTSTESHAVQSECVVKISEPDTTIKFQSIENGSGIHDADAPKTHSEIGKNSFLEDGRDSIKSEKMKSSDLEYIKTKIDDIIDEAKKVVERLREGTIEMEEREHKRDIISKTGSEQFPVPACSSEMSLKIFQPAVTENAQNLPRNTEVRYVSRGNQEEAANEGKSPQEEEPLSREKDALQAFGKIFVSGPVLIKSDASESESPERATKPISESDSNQAASDAVEKDKREEEAKGETEINSFGCSNSDAKSETDAVHRIFREVDGGRSASKISENRSSQASCGGEREARSEDEPIYCNIDEIEEIKVTTERDRRSRRPQSSKLTEQILKAIPPPRRKPFTDAKTEVSVTSPETSIPPRTASTLLDRPIAVADAEAGETSSAETPPVPPRRTRSKGRQPPLPPPKRRKK